MCVKFNALYSFTFHRSTAHFAAFRWHLKYGMALNFPFGKSPIGRLPRLLGIDRLPGQSFRAATGGGIVRAADWSDVRHCQSTGPETRKLRRSPRLDTTSCSTGALKTFPCPDLWTGIVGCRCQYQVVIVRFRPNMVPFCSRWTRDFSSRIIAKARYANTVAIGRSRHACPGLAAAVAAA